jgi:ribosome-associated toxin RatA of RatAB toxin-antitoxin module
MRKKHHKGTLRLGRLAVAAWLTWLLPASAAPPLPTPACVACQADTDELRAQYSATDWDALIQEKIVTTRNDRAGTEGGVKSSVASSVIIPRTASQVWSVLDDFTARPEFMPGIKEVRVERVEGNRVWLAERIRVLWSNIRYHIIGTLDPEHGIMSWVLDRTADNDIKDTQGSWQLASLPLGRTLVRYSARVDTGRPVPGFIERFFVKRSLPKIVGALRAEVEKRFPDS